MTSEPVDRSARALSFGSVAGEYERFRPGPPDEAVSWLVPDGARDVADIGAGTGALTRLLTARAARVIAVEPDPRMGSVLRGRVPGAHLCIGRAEDLPVRDGSLDAVLGASMWHWVNVDRAVPAIARALRPGGVLGVLWSGPRPEGSPLAAVLRRPVANRPRPPVRELRLPAGAPFTEPEQRMLTWTRPTTRDELIGLAGTYSRVICLPDDEQQQVRDSLVDAVEQLPELATGDVVDLPMGCICWRAMKLA